MTRKELYKQLSTVYAYRHYQLGENLIVPAEKIDFHFILHIIDGFGETCYRASSHNTSQYS